ncbi:metallophosphoesterase [Thalassotalea sp. LPB0316]|uniref:metallophosphoesterase n=1 Tax=Thalassotalea sp. LPB0316 TaxID=2769490 RepID=UPI00186629DD|nr:metallophosphoesterase [Thalassotalea sp. LPB0316]QOL25098.1 metallophosphoesterase [Thalassotalea sp. LPB0316]
MKTLKFWRLFAVTWLYIFGAAIAEAQTQPLSDGPYVRYTDSTITYDVEYVCDGQAQSKKVNVISLTLGRYKACQQNGPALGIVKQQFERDNIEYNGDFDVIAVSDFHGQHKLMLELLRNNKVIDQNDHWALGKGHLVITGDVFDRGDRVTEILWFLYRLEQQAQLAGGKLHLLIGNHEVMVFNNDLRYLNPKYRDVSQILQTPYPKLYDNNSVIGRWLRSKNVIVKINQDLYLHGGLSHQLLQYQQSLGQINQLFINAMVKDEMPRQRNRLESFLHGRQGPIWYRGYFYWPIIPIAQLEQVLAYYQSNRVIVGHTSYSEIKVRFKGKVLAIDSSIKKGKYGELLKVSEGRYYRLTLSGDVEQLNIK